MLDYDALAREIRQGMRDAHVPGLALAVVRREQVVYAEGFGVASVEDPLPAVTARTLFRIGSVTKLLTGAAVMRLVEAEALELDAPVKEYVPWLDLGEEGAADRVTLRMLLSHTAGLPTDIEFLGKDYSGGLEEYVREMIPAYPLVAPPGKVYCYSNPGVSLAGYVAEVAAGKPYRELVRELVFEPLGMDRTTFDLPVAMTYPLAQCHDLGEDGELRVRHRFVDNQAGDPAAFAFSSVLDLANLAVCLMNRGRSGGKYVLSPGSVSEMRTVQAEMYTPRRTGYGLTLRSEDYKGTRRVWHDGMIDTYRTKFAMIPDAKLAVIMQYNRIAGEAVFQGIIDGVFDEVLDLPQEPTALEVVEPDRSLWPLYAGSYVGSIAGLIMIGVTEGQLELDTHGRKISLQPAGQGVYSGPAPDREGRVTVGFVPEESGPVRYVVYNGGPSPLKRFERDPAWAPDVDAWRSYVGAYTGMLDGQALRVEIGLEEERLTIRFSWFDVASRAWLDHEEACIPLDNTRFASTWGSMRFVVGERGAQTLRFWDVSTFTRDESSRRSVADGYTHAEPA